MKIIKLGLISFIMFGLLITAISFLFPSHIRVSKAENIGSQKDSLLPLLLDITAWKKWYPGFDTLPFSAVTQAADGSSATVKNVRINVVRSTDGAEAIFKQEGKEPILQHWRIVPHGSPDSVTVQWYTDIHLRWYPWEKFSSLLFERRYGSVIETGLSSLKSLAEK